MSGEVALWAARQDIKNHAAKMVLIALGDAFDDRTGLCFPSHQTICDFVRRAQTQIKEAIRWLEENGWIKRDTRFTEKGRQTTNGYELIFERGESFEAMVARRRKVRGEGGGGGKSGGGGKPTGEGAENRPPKEAENRPPRTESLNNNSAQAREVDKSIGEGEGMAEEARWRHRLELYRQKGVWPPSGSWGPRMGQPGCRVPKHLVKLWDETQGAAFKPEKPAPRKKPAQTGHATPSAFRRVGDALPRYNRPGTSHD